MKFDEAYWLKVIKHPDWYLEFYDFASKIQMARQNDKDKLHELSKQIRHFFEEALVDSKVALGKDGYDFDQERQPVDRVVIHHTSHEPGYRLSYLNAVHLLNIYVPVYAKGVNPGQPIWSGHFKDDQQVFWGYHWLMRMDGKFEKLLEDNQIGWHAGNWAINKRSIGICLDNDYENQDPTDDILQKLAKFIKEKYPGAKIIGHCEATKTTCPGTDFLKVWKSKLLNYL